MGAYSPQLERLYAELLRLTEFDDAQRPGLAETPERAARSWDELVSGYGPAPLLKWFEPETKGLIVTEGITFHSLCEHHLLPFFGEAHIAYLPLDKMVGLSKLARLVDHYSRRLQVQERLGEQIAEELLHQLNPMGVLVITKAQHLCMSMRGIQKLGSQTTHSVAHGILKSSQQTKEEAMRLMGI